jgi:hypothetical protein
LSLWYTVLKIDKKKITGVACGPNELRAKSFLHLFSLEVFDYRQREGDGEKEIQMFLSLTGQNYIMLISQQIFRPTLVDGFLFLILLFSSLI